MEILKWKIKGFLSEKVVILQDKLLIGMLKTSAWNSAAYGEVRGRMLRFEREKWFSSVFVIKDVEGVHERGRIVFRFWGRKAEIVLDGVKYTYVKTSWVFNNFKIVSEEGDELVGTSDRWLARTGTLRFDYIDPALFLVGLYLMGLIRKRQAYAS